MVKNKFLTILVFGFILIASFWVIRPLFHTGFFPMHDDTQPSRVFEMGKALRDGMFPVRWIRDLGYGYGYPLFNFYAPLAYYVGGLFSLVMDSLFATKIMIALGMIFSGLTMYLLGKSLWGKWGGIFSGILYLFAPYHAVDLYVRGDIAELWAYAFFPLALLGVWLCYQKPNWQNMAVGAVGFAGVILSHNLSAFLFAPFLFLAIFFAIVFSIRKQGVKILYMAGVGIFGILLSSWYIFPVFSEMKYTNVLSQVGGSADFHEHFVCLYQLWQSQWGFGGSVVGCTDGFSFMIGKLHILISLAAFFLLPFIWRKSKALFCISLILITCLVVSIFLTLSFSKSLWEFVPQMAFLQYPWRYLLMISLYMSLLGGSCIWYIERLNTKLVPLFAIAVSVGVILFSAKYFLPQKNVVITAKDYISQEVLAWNISRISDEYMPPSFSKPQEKSSVSNAFLNVDAQQGSWKMLSDKTQEKIVTVSLARQGNVLFHLAYFPAWNAFVNDKKIHITPSDKGMLLYLQKGKSTVMFRYEETQIERFGNLVSLTSVAVLILGIIWQGRHSRYDEKSA